MPTFSLEYLLELHKYYVVVCKKACQDENVHELRRNRRLVAEAIAARL